MKRLWLVLVFALTLAVAAGSAQPGGLQRLRLILSAYGIDTYVVWKAQEGLPDRIGSGNYALEFERGIPGPGKAAAAYAVVININRVPVSFLTRGSGLSWERRNDGDCVSHSPRWNLHIKGSSGAEYWIRLFCTAADHSPGSAAAWTLDSFSGSRIEQEIWTVHGMNAPDVLSGTIMELYIVFAVGPDVGQGFVYLDNIGVNGTRWTSPLDR